MNHNQSDQDLITLRSYKPSVSTSRPSGDVMNQLIETKWSFPPVLDKTDVKSDWFTLSVDNSNEAAFAVAAEPSPSLTMTTSGSRVEMAVTVVVTFSMSAFEV